MVCQFMSIHGKFVTSLTAYYSRADISRGQWPCGYSIYKGNARILYLREWDINSPSCSLVFQQHWTGSCALCCLAGIPRQDKAQSKEYRLRFKRHHGFYSLTRHHVLCKIVIHYYMIPSSKVGKATFLVSLA